MKSEDQKLDWDQVFQFSEEVLLEFEERSKATFQETSQDGTCTPPPGPGFSSRGSSRTPSSGDVSKAGSTTPHRRYDWNSLHFFPDIHDVDMPVQQPGLFRKRAPRTASFIEPPAGQQGGWTNTKSEMAALVLETEAELQEMWRAVQQKQEENKERRLVEDAATREQDKRKLMEAHFRLQQQRQLRKQQIKKAMQQKYPDQNFDSSDEENRPPPDRDPQQQQLVGGMKRNASYSGPMERTEEAMSESDSVSSSPMVWTKNPMHIRKIKHRRSSDPFRVSSENGSNIERRPSDLQEKYEKFEELQKRRRELESTSEESLPSSNKKDNVAKREQFIIKRRHSEPRVRKSPSPKVERSYEAESSQTTKVVTYEFSQDQASQENEEDHKMDRRIFGQRLAQFEQISQGTTPPRPAKLPQPVKFTDRPPVSRNSQQMTSTESSFSEHHISSQSHQMAPTHAAPPGIQKPKAKVPKELMDQIQISEGYGNAVQTPDFYNVDQKRFSRAFETKEVLSDEKDPDSGYQSRERRKREAYDEFGEIWRSESEVTPEEKSFVRFSQVIRDVPDAHRQYQMEKTEVDKYRNMSSSFENIYDDVDLALYASPVNEVDYDDRKPKHRPRRHQGQRDDGYQPYPLPHASQYRRDGYTLPPQQQSHGRQGLPGMPEEVEGYPGHQGSHPGQQGGYPGQVRNVGHPGLQGSHQGHPGSQQRLPDDLDRQFGQLQSSQVQLAQQSQQSQQSLPSQPQEGASSAQAPPRGDSNDQGQIPQKGMIIGKYNARAIVEEERQKYAMYKAHYEKQYSWPNSPESNVEHITPDGASSKGYHSDPMKQSGPPHVTPDGASSKGYHSDPMKQSGNLSPELAHLIHHERQPAMFIEPFGDQAKDKSKGQPKSNQNQGVDLKSASFDKVDNNMKYRGPKPVYTMAPIQADFKLINKKPKNKQERHPQQYQQGRNPKSADPVTYGENNYPQTYPEHRPAPVLGSPARGRRAWAEGSTPDNARKVQPPKEDYRYPSEDYVKMQQRNQPYYRSQEDQNWEQQQERHRLSYQDPKEVHSRDAEKYRPRKGRPKPYNDYVNIEVFWDHQQQQERQQRFPDYPQDGVTRHRPYMPPAGERAVLPPGNQRDYNGHAAPVQQHPDDAHYYYEKETTKYTMPAEEPQRDHQFYEHQEQRKNKVNSTHHQINLRERPSSAPVAQDARKNYRSPEQTNQQPQAPPAGYQHYEVPIDRSVSGPEKQDQSSPKKRNEKDDKKKRKSRKEQYEDTKQLGAQRRRSWHDNLPEYQRTIAVHTPSPSPDRRGKARRSWSRERPQSEHGVPLERQCEQDKSATNNTNDVLKKAGVYFNKSAGKSQEDLIYHKEITTTKQSPLQTPTSAPVSLSFPEASRSDPNPRDEETYVEVSKILNNKSNKILQRQHSDPAPAQRSVNIPVHAESPNYKQEIAFSITGVRKDFAGPPTRKTLTKLPQRPASTDHVPPEKVTKPQKLNITLRSKSFDDLDSGEVHKSETHVVNVQQEPDATIQNELHFIQQRRKGMVDSVKSEVFNSQEDQQDRIRSIPIQVDTDDIPIFDIVSYKDGEKYPKPAIQDALAELEQTFDALNLDKDIDEEFEPAKPNVKRLSITNLKNFEEMQQTDVPPSLDYTRQWLGESDKTEAEERRLGEASPASMEVAALSLPAQPDISYLDQQRSSSASSEVKYYITGVQNYPLKKSDDMAYRKTKTSPKSPAKEYNIPIMFQDNSGFIRQRSNSAPKIEVLPGNQQDRRPRREQFRPAPDQATDYNQVSSSPNKPRSTERSSHKRVVYSLRGRSQSFEGLQHEGQGRSQVQWQVQSQSHTSQSSRPSYHKQKSEPTPKFRSESFTDRPNQFESPRRVFGSAPDLSDTSTFSDQQSNDPRQPRSAVKPKKQQTPRTVKQRHEMKVKVRHLKTGPDSYIYAVDSENDSPSPSSSGNEHQGMPRSPLDGITSPRSTNESGKASPHRNSGPVRKAYYDNTGDIISQESRSTYLVDDPHNQRSTKQQKHPSQVGKRIQMADFNVTVRPSPRQPRQTYLTEDRMDPSPRLERQGNVTNIPINFQGRDDQNNKKSKDSTATVTPRDQSDSYKSSPRKTPQSPARPVAPVVPATTAPVRQEREDIPPRRPEQPVNYHQHQDHVDGLPGPLSLLNDQSALMLQSKLQEVKRDQDSTAEAKLVEAYEAKIKQMREERKKTRPYSMTSALESPDSGRSNEPKKDNSGDKGQGSRTQILGPRPASLENLNIRDVKPERAVPPPKPARLHQYQPQDRSPDRRQDRRPEIPPRLGRSPDRRQERRPEVPQYQDRSPENRQDRADRRQDRRPDIPQHQERSQENRQDRVDRRQDRRPEIPQRKGKVKVSSLTVMASKPDVVKDTEGACSVVSDEAPVDNQFQSSRSHQQDMRMAHSFESRESMQSFNVRTSSHSHSERLHSQPDRPTPSQPDRVAHSAPHTSSFMMREHLMNQSRPSASHSESATVSTSSIPIKSLVSVTKVSHTRESKLKSKDHQRPTTLDVSDTAAQLVQSASSLPVQSMKVITPTSPTEQKPRTTSTTYTDSSSKVFRTSESSERSGRLERSTSGQSSIAMIQRDDSTVQKSQAKPQTRTVIHSSDRRVHGHDFESKESNYSSMTSKIPKSSQGDKMATRSSGNVTRTTVGLSKSSIASSSSNQKQKMQIVVQQEKVERKPKVEKLEMSKSQKSGVQKGPKEVIVPIPIKQVTDLKRAFHMRNLHSPAESADDSFDNLDALIARQPEMSADELDVTDTEVMTDDTDAHTDIMVHRAISTKKKTYTAVPEEAEEPEEREELEESDSTISRHSSASTESLVSEDEKSSRRAKRGLEPERRRSIKELVNSFESKASPFMKSSSIPLRRCSSHESVQDEPQKKEEI